MLLTFVIDCKTFILFYVFVMVFGFKLLKRKYKRKTGEVSTRNLCYHGNELLEGKFLFSRMLGKNSLKIGATNMLVKQRENQKTHKWNRRQ